MYMYVVDQRERMAVRDLHVYRVNGGMVHARSPRASFFAGARHIIHQRLVEGRQIFESSNVQAGALMVMKETDLRSALARLGPHLKIIHEDKRVLHSLDGYEQGQQAGRQVKLQEAPQLTQIRAEIDAVNE